MNFSDLFVVVVLVSALYGLVVALTGRKHFLAHAVNPHRWAWLFAALTIFWSGVTLLRLEAKSWDGQQWAQMLSQLVSDAPAPVRVKVAAVAILLGAIFFTLLLWCCLFLPRDPSAYHKPKHRQSALKYYVVRLQGGLCYALLSGGSGEVIAEAVDRRQLQRQAPHLPQVHPPGEVSRDRHADEQIQFWRTLAQRLHQHMGQLDALIAQAYQGRNRRLVFDGEYGGLFFEYLRLSDPHAKQDTSVYLFGATVSQREMDNRRADQHFQLLMAALKSIERGIRMG